MKKEPRESSSSSDSSSFRVNSSEAVDFFLFFLEAMVLVLDFLAAFSFLSYFLFQKANSTYISHGKIRDGKTM